MQPRDRQAYLWDVLNSAALIQQFVSGRTLTDYSADAMLRSAVERQFEIIGEAIVQLSQRFPDTASRIAHFPQIIGFRNRLIHGYNFVADDVVWSVIETDLSLLQQQVKALLAELESQHSSDAS